MFFKRAAKDLLDGHKATCNYGPFGLEMEINGRWHNISLLLENADLTQLVLDTDDIEKYPAILAANNTHKLDIIRTVFMASQSLTDKHNVEQIQNKNPGLKDLRHGEVLAINIYTDSLSYNLVNRLLRDGSLAKYTDKAPELLNDLATQTLLLSMLSVSGLNRIEGSEPLPDDLVSIRSDGVLLAAVVSARLKAVEEYKKNNYVDSFTEMKGLISTSAMLGHDISYKYRIVSNESDKIYENLEIGFYVTDECVVIKARGAEDVKIDKSDQLWAVIKGIHDAGRYADCEFTANEKDLVNNLVLSNSNLVALVQSSKHSIGLFDNIYRTKFTALVGKNEILLPPVTIQWVDAQIDVDGKKIYFIGHPINALEVQKDTTIVRGYNAFKSLQLDLSSSNELRKNLETRLKDIQDTETCLASDIWREGVSILINDYSNQLGEAELAIQGVENIAALKANVDKILEKASKLKEISLILKDEKNMLLHEFAAVLRILISKKTPDGDNLLEIQTEVHSLLQKSKITTDDLTALAEKIKQKRLASNKEADVVFGIVLEKLLKIEPTVGPQKAEISKETISELQQENEQLKSATNKPVETAANKEEISDVCANIISAMELYGYLENITNDKALEKGCDAFIKKVNYIVGLLEKDDPLFNKKDAIKLKEKIEKNVGKIANLDADRIAEKFRDALTKQNFFVRMKDSPLKDRIVNALRVFAAICAAIVVFISKGGVQSLRSWLATKRLVVEVKKPVNDMHNSFSANM